AWV
ncbi:hypothetical protein D046_3122, partial [Vibrio parahaemolyticus V-223/04]